jgi:ComF family protein
VNGRSFQEMGGVVKSRLLQLASALLDLCFPRRCAACQQAQLLSHQGFWCSACREQIPWVQAPLCPCCGRPFPNSPTSSNHLCEHCLRDLFLFDTARSATIYAGAIRDRIQQLKFGGQLHWIPPLVDLLLQGAAHGCSVAATQLIVPVPLHTKRIRQRGFNQSALIAQGLGRRCGLPVLPGVLIRHRSTQPQTRLGRRERLQNVRGAFSIAHPALIRDRSLLLVDDVFTTGTTLNECARVLKAAGVREVHAVTVARALPDWAGEDPQRTAGLEK